MMKIKYWLISIVFFFLCVISVNAGVCDEKPKDPQSRYCNLGITYQYPAKESTDLYKDRYFAKNGSAGFLGYAYEASGTTFSGQKEIAFCLDPSKKDPNSYSYGRELILGVKYDKAIYKTYQYYVNNVAAATNANNYISENKQRYLAYTDVTLRIFTAAAGYDLDLANKAPYYYYNILPYIISDNKGKLIEHVGGVANLYNNTNTSGTCKKTDSNLSNFSSCGKDWVSSKDVLNEEYGVKKYFKTIITGDMLWENPLTITPTEEIDSNGNHIYSFKVEFKKNNYVYFGVSSAEKHYDYNIGYGHAFFEFINYEINGIRYDDSYGSKTVPKASISASNGPSANDEVIYQISIPSEKFEELKSDGKVDVKMVYKTYHPMSDENVFINYINERNSDSESLYQRMIVFTKYANEKKVGIESEITNICRQDENSFYINDIPKTLEEYISECGCNAVYYDDLNSSNRTIYENADCRKTVITVTSDLKSCDEDEEKGNYNIIYKAEREINEYCSLTCTEDVKINDLVRKNQNLSVKAGMWFPLPQYPELVTSKKCVVNMREHKIFEGTDNEKIIKGYDGWIKDYQLIISALPDLYNDKEYYAKAVFSSDESCCCSWCQTPDGEPFCCGGWSCKRKYYDTHYNSSKYFSNEILFDNNVNDTFNYACNSDNLVFDQSETLEAYNNAVADLKKLLNKLNKCTTTIKNMGLSNDEYYTFKQDMNFYYEQEYSNDSIGFKYNDERPNNVNDTELIFGNFEETNSVSSKYIPASGKFYYDGINTDGMGSKNTTNYDSKFVEYERIVSYEYNESTSNVYKYADTFSGKISSVKTSLKNPIDLGYVYDIDASAKAKNDNENYYVFNALGDDNKIYNHFRDGKLVNNSPSSLEDLKRYCTYEITNELLKTENVGDGSSKLNIVYRIVDPKKIDPNDRLSEEDKGFQNWKSHLDVKEEIENKDTYDPKHIEYSFELDSKTIKDIREYNNLTNYSDFDLDCDDNGNKCESDFVEEYAKKDDSGDMIGNGRSEWKGLGGE